MTGRCYITGNECDCGAYDVAGDCPHDEYVHDDDETVEDMIENEYYSRPRGHDDEIERF